MLDVENEIYMYVLDCDIFYYFLQMYITCIKVKYQYNETNVM